VCDVCVDRVLQAKLDDVFALLAKKLGLTEADLEPPTIPMTLPATTVDRVYPLKRYDAHGVRVASDAPDQSTEIDLRDGAKVRVVIPEASNFDMVATVAGLDDEGNFQFQVKREGKLARTYLLGRWWVALAMEGAVARFPIMNAQ